MRLVCEECASSDVRRVTREGFVVEECGLCGHLQGDVAVVERIEEIREARTLGIPIELFRLIETLDCIEGLAVERTLSVVTGQQNPPAVFFQLSGRHPLEILDRLLRSLLHAGEHLHHRWIVEVTHQTRLQFVLRPRLFQRPVDLLSSERQRFLDDLRRIGDGLARDQQLPWWEMDSR